MSQASAISNPPANAYPSTAAMSGFSGGRSTTPAKPRPGIDGRSPARNALRSIPAQNVPPAPVITPATSAVSESSRSMAAPIASAVTVLIALRASGRSMVTTRTPDSTRVLTGALTAAPSGSLRRAGSSRR